MPYFPNSMVLDRTGTNLYFGSAHELMIYSATTNTLSKEDTNVPGVVLAAAPNNQQILINDPVRQVFYLYSPSGATFSTFNGVGTWAQWTPDAQTLYVVGYTTNATNATYTPTLFVYNTNTGWTTYPLAAPTAQVPPPANLTVTVPGIGAFLSSTSTGSKTADSTAFRAWCPTLNGNTINQAYPQAASVPVQTDALAATTDGAHILGVGLDGGNTPTLTDIGVNYNQSLVNGACPSVGGTSGPITTSPVTQFQSPAGALGFQATAINQVVVSPASNLAFFTYTPNSTSTNKLWYYQPTTNGAAGSLGSLTFNEPSATTPAATAPLTGVFSLDDTLFFVSTSGDNLVHYINVNTLQDTQQINPGLVDGNGNPVPASFLAAKPRPTT
jgi:hypothetical protein